MPAHDAGHYDLIDFVVVLIGYVVSGEPTLLAFYERLTPFAEPFMALFGRASASPSLDALPPSRLAWIKRQWKRFVRYAQEDLLARKPFAFPGGLFDRTGAQWVVADVDGTRATARQRALPQTDALPAPHRRFDQVWAPGYQGRKRGEIVRTRTVLLQAHTHQFFGTDAGIRQWGLQRRTATGYCGDDQLCRQAWASPSPRATRV